MRGAVTVIHNQQVNPLASLNPAFDWMRPHAGNTHSQFGEDGLIDAFFTKHPPVNRWCLEVGAGNGTKLSNTRRLINAGWTGIMIEADRALFDKIPTQANVHRVHEMIKPRSLDRILEECGAPEDLDFLSLDIDGQDYYCLEGLTEHRPRLLCVEFSPRGENSEHGFIPELGGSGQATLTPIMRLVASKGYVPIFQTTVNVLAVAKEVL